MSKRSRQGRTQEAGAAAPHAAVRVVAGSLVLSVVLSTLALHAASGQARAQGMPAQQGETRRIEPVEVNVLPLRELMRRAAEAARRGELRFDTPLQLDIEADRDADGSLSNVHVLAAQGDQRALDMAREFVAALSESHALSVLKAPGHMTFGLRLDGSKLLARLAAEVASEQRAAEMAQGYGWLLDYAAHAKAGRPEAALYRGMRLSASGKQLALTLDMPREAAGNLLLQLITPN